MRNLLLLIALLVLVSSVGWGQSCTPSYDPIQGKLVCTASHSSGSTTGPVVATFTAPSTCSTTGGTGTNSCTLTSGTTLVVTHNLGTSQPWVTCYDGSGNMLGSSGAGTSVTSAVATSASVVTITFSGSTTGACVTSTGSIGPQGAAGATGATGPAGTNGTNGTNGAGFNGRGTYAQMTASSPSINDTWQLTDSTADGQCSAGGSTHYAICMWTGSAWTVSSGSSVTPGTSIAVNGSTISYNPFDTSQVILFDEPFCTSGNPNGAAGAAVTIGRTNWSQVLTNSGTLVAVTKSAATDLNHLCGVAIKAPASINNGVAIFLGNNSTTAQIPSGIFTASQFRPFEVQWQGKLSSTSNIRFYLALGNNTGVYSGSNLGCGFEYDTNNSDTGWIGFCADQSVKSTTAVILAADTSIHRFRMWQTAQGTVNFSIDGGTTATITTHIPNSTSSFLHAAMVIANDGTSTTSQMDLFRAVGRVTGLVVN